MDEFCANKDTQLKRCACSAKVHNFDGIKQQMSQVEDKMLDFNERLLTVSMEKEDATAISIATTGELAFQTDDKSTSKKILDEITKKLKSETAETDMSRNLSAISLSLDTDSAFDTIDSMLGAGTTVKEGTALYAAALPVCREMAAEVCDADALAIAQSGYQMAIEQDCNTVSKTYETMRNTALEKVREGSALLEMSRLDIHQKRNSDDILTCKKKMLDMMSDVSVCGTDLGKCLDTTGKYIDPSTGEAFLTVNLADLDKLITRPASDQKWISVPGNEKFVTFMNSKKKYLEPAMENCQDISDQVWTMFLEDALAQIKIAQSRKLEDMRQSCTSLTTQCLSDTAKSISEFDARALSIFGVSADKTVNEMCTSVKSACTALLQTTSTEADWVGGMSEIQTDKTYDTIVQTCREVGKACIIQTCKSVSGNFGLCESIDKSVNRKSIINRTSCWNEVVQCVQSAGATSIASVMKRHAKAADASGGGNFYVENYGKLPVRVQDPLPVQCNPKTVTNSDGTTTPGQNCVYDICADCGQPYKPTCEVCRLAESIWGNCEFKPTEQLSAGGYNRIKKTVKDRETLLSWFDTNTGTTTNTDSCRDTSCPAGSFLNAPGGYCVPSDQMSSDLLECVQEKQFDVSTTLTPSFTNCCTSGIYDVYGNCCIGGNVTIPGMFQNNATSYYITPSTITPPASSLDVCTQSSGTDAKLTAGFRLMSDQTYIRAGMNFLVCVGGTLRGTNPTTAFPSGQTVECDGGKFMMINNNDGTYATPHYATKVDGTPDPTQYPTSPANYYNLNSQDTPQTACILNLSSKIWATKGGNPNTSNPACIKTGVAPDFYPTAFNKKFIGY